MKEQVVTGYFIESTNDQMSLQSIKEGAKVSLDKRLTNDDREVLRGSVITQFEHQYKRIGDRLGQAKASVLQIQSIGANAVIFVLNAAYFNDSRYRSDLKEILDYARKNGMTSILSLHADGDKGYEGKNTWTTPKLLNKVDTSLKNKWMSLLTSEDGKDIIANMDAFILVQEAGPLLDDNGMMATPDFRWNDDMDSTLTQPMRLESLLKKGRSALGRGDGGQEGMMI